MAHLFLCIRIDLRKLIREDGDEDRDKQRAAERTGVSHSLQLVNESMTHA